MLLGAASLALTGCAAAQPPPKMLFDASLCPRDAAEPSGERVVARFYEAFARHDFAGMACNYDPNVEFTDSIFGTLKGKRAFAMWAMLVRPGQDLVVVHSQVRTDGATTRAHWDAHYTFPFLAFNNKVDNAIDATFELKDGKIVRHRDQFDLRRWMKMALWPFGGAASEATVRGAVQSRLDDFIEKHPEFQEPKHP
ncbi:Ketosteroid isomerase-related protein [Minicystis rosea]|nr:Ketosteroid isomerase-related protein [Minicystis rosea]